MRTAGIIAEYNPFHNGHRYQIEMLRRQGFEQIVAVMSGNFVQRGEPAIFDKWTRTRAALLNGVDLVVEIPIQAVLSSAQGFATGAVTVLEQLGVVDTLCFGSESGDLSLLQRAAALLRQPQMQHALQSCLKTSATYAALLQQAVGSIDSNAAEVFSSPNDTLGVEYINALYRLRSNIQPYALLRQRVGHHDSTRQDGFAAAAFIRSLIYAQGSYAALVPASAARLYETALPARLEHAHNAVVWRLRQMRRADFARLPGLSEGLQNRLYAAARQARTLEEFYALCKTKRYTMARLKRLTLRAVLPVPDLLSPYIRVLGFSSRGERLLKSVKKNAGLPVVTSYRGAVHRGPAARAYYEETAACTDFYTLCTANPCSCGMEMRQSVVKI